MNLFVASLPLRTSEADLRVFFKLLNLEAVEPHVYFTQSTFAFLQVPQQQVAFACERYDGVEYRKQLMHVSAVRRAIGCRKCMKFGHAEEDCVPVLANSIPVLADPMPIDPVPMPADSMLVDSVSVLADSVLVNPVSVLADSMLVDPVPALVDPITMLADSMLADTVPVLADSMLADTVLLSPVPILADPVLVNPVQVLTDSVPVLANHVPVLASSPQVVSQATALTEQAEKLPASPKTPIFFVTETPDPSIVFAGEWSSGSSCDDWPTHERQAEVQIDREHPIEDALHTPLKRSSRWPSEERRAEVQIGRKNLLEDGFHTPTPKRSRRPVTPFSSINQLSSLTLSQSSKKIVRQMVGELRSDGAALFSDCSFRLIKTPSKPPSRTSRVICGFCKAAILVRNIPKHVNSQAHQKASENSPD